MAKLLNHGMEETLNKYGFRQQEGFDTECFLHEDGTWIWAETVEELVTLFYHHAEGDGGKLIAKVAWTHLPSYLENLRA